MGSRKSRRILGLHNSLAGAAAQFLVVALVAAAVEPVDPGQGIHMDLVVDVHMGLHMIDIQESFLASMQQSIQ